MMKRLQRSSKFLIRRVRADNGLEFDNQVVKNYCRDEGKDLEFSNSYCPAESGFAERSNREVTEMARALLTAAKMPTKYWSFAVKTAVHTLNRVNQLKVGVKDF